MSCPLARAVLIAAFSFWVGAASPLLAQQTQARSFPSDLQPLLSALQRAKYTVLLAPPPIPGAYGATDSRRKRIWVAPISIDLGIVRQTLIHEAVHAAQSCPTGKLTPLGIDVPLSYKIDREISGLLYRGYAHSKFEVEREAFALQGQAGAPALLIRQLDQRCR